LPSFGLKLFEVERNWKVTNPENLESASDNSFCCVMTMRKKGYSFWARLFTSYDTISFAS
jgi:hypothetical protein